MRIYTPNKWVVIKVNNNENIFYRVFGCWYGGYASSDSWRINSGIERAKKEGDFWLFGGFSGSTYKCHEKNYGTHNYGNLVLTNFITQAKKEKVEIKEMEENTNWDKLVYAI